MPICEKNRRTSIERIFASANAAGFNTRGFHNSAVSEFFSQFVHGVVQANLLFIVVEQINLVSARNQMAEAHANEAYEYPSRIKFFEEFEYFRNKNVVCRSVRNASLHGFRLKIGISQFYRNARSKLFSFAQLARLVLSHSN